MDILKALKIEQNKVHKRLEGIRARDRSLGRKTRQAKAEDERGGEEENQRDTESKLAEEKGRKMSSYCPQNVPDLVNCVSFVGSITSLNQ